MTPGHETGVVVTPTAAFEVGNRSRGVDLQGACEVKEFSNFDSRSPSPLERAIKHPAPRKEVRPSRKHDLTSRPQAPV